jgi:hypothetical protein
MKALARRGEAHEKLEHYEEAIAGKFGFNIIVKTIILLLNLIIFSLFRWISWIT